MNAFRICHLAVGETTSNQWQRINAFLFTAGIHCDGLSVAGVLGQHFGGVNPFRIGLAKVLADPRTKRLQNDVLLKLRNTVVFHYDRDAAAEALSRLQLENFVFATGVGPKNGDLYYKFANEVALNRALGQSASEAGEKLKLCETITDVIDVCLVLVDSAEQRIVDVIGELGFEGKEP